MSVLFLVEHFFGNILEFENAEETMAVCIEIPFCFLVLILLLVRKKHKFKKNQKKKWRGWQICALVTGLVAWACGIFAAFAHNSHLVLGSVASGIVCYVFSCCAAEGNLLVIIFALFDLLVIASYTQVQDHSLIVTTLICIRVLLLAILAALAAYDRAFADDDDSEVEDDDIVQQLPTTIASLRQPLLSTSTNTSISSLWSGCFDGIFLRPRPSDDYQPAVFVAQPPPPAIISSHRAVLEEENEVDDTESISQLADEEDSDSLDQEHGEKYDTGPNKQDKTTTQFHQVERPTILKYQDELRVRVAAVCIAEALGVTDTLRENLTGTLGSGRILYRIELMRAKLEGWTCVKSYAQLRELIKYAKRQNFLQSSFYLRRPKPLQNSNFLHTDTAVWSTSESEALKEADAALQAILRNQCPVILLFLETDILEYDRAQRWDLLVTEGTALRWMPCSREDDEKRRAQSRSQLELDARMSALNCGTTFIAKKSVDMTELAYEAATLASALLIAAGVPNDTRADVSETLDHDLFFGRLEPAEARLLKGGDGAAMYLEVTQTSTIRSRFSNNTSISSLKRRHTSLPPALLSSSSHGGKGVTKQSGLTLDELIPTNNSVESVLYDHFDDGSSGGAWITLARLRHALLHTSAWRRFRAIVGWLRYTRISSGGIVLTREARLARAATLVNLHSILAFHCVLAWGAGSGRHGSTQRCLDAARYALASNPDDDPTSGVQGVSLVSLELALLRLPTKIPSEQKKILGRAGLLLGAGQAGRIELRAAFLLCSGRAAGAPFFALPPKKSYQLLRTAARIVLEASLDVFSQSEISLPYSFRRTASLAATRSWGDVAQGEGRRRRARRAHLLRTVGLDRNNNEWGAAADDQRRMDRQSTYFSSSDDDDDEIALTEKHSSLALLKEKNGHSSDEEDEDDEIIRTSMAIDEEHLDEDPDMQQQSRYAIKNLIDFLLATGGPNTKAKLQAATDILAQLNDDSSIDGRIQYRFRPPDLRPALRLLQIPSNDPLVHLT